jgi:hypothetical protein
LIIKPSDDDSLNDHSETRISEISSKYDRTQPFLLWEPSMNCEARESEFFSFKEIILDQIRHQRVRLKNLDFEVKTLDHYNFRLREKFEHMLAQNVLSEFIKLGATFDSVIVEQIF